MQITLLNNLTRESIDKWISEIVPWFLDHGVKILIIILAAWLLNKITNRAIKRTVRVATLRDANVTEEGRVRREDTLNRIFKGALQIAIITLAVMFVLQETGLNIGPLIAGAGIVGLALGFGGQYLIRDLITGVFIIIENQYRIGDVINVDSIGGLVEDISLRKTTLRDLNGTVHHIPHGEIKRVSNLSKRYARVNLDIGISYKSDLEHVIRVINKTGEELASDPLFSDSIITPPQFLRVDNFADSAIIVKVLGDTKSLKQWEITGEFRKRIKIAFDKEGIEIPFPQMVIHQASGKQEPETTIK